MLRKLVYNGERKFMVLHPHNIIVEKGKEITVNDKKTANDLIELGFEEVAEGKEEIEQLEEKAEEKPKRKTQKEGE